MVHWCIRRVHSGFSLVSSTGLKGVLSPTYLLCTPACQCISNGSQAILAKTRLDLLLSSKPNALLPVKVKFSPSHVYISTHIYTALTTHTSLTNAHLFMYFVWIKLCHVRCNEKYNTGNFTQTHLFFSLNFLQQVEVLNLVTPIFGSSSMPYHSYLSNDEVSSCL